MYQHKASIAEQQTGIESKLHYRIYFYNKKKTLENNSLNMNKRYIHSI